MKKIIDVYLFLHAYLSMSYKIFKINLNILKIIKSIGNDNLSNSAEFFKFLRLILFELQSKN